MIEVKSTKDQYTPLALEKTSDAKVIKNNKRSAQHQLRDHFEVLENTFCPNLKQQGLQQYIMWPFLTPYTKDPRQQMVKRWKEDQNLHVFEDTILEQNKFNEWFKENILKGQPMKEDLYTLLLNRFIILSCGVFVDEINHGLMALLTQEQLHLLNYKICQNSKALVAHGAAGTGKTLLVLRKLQQLYQNGRLNAQNRALFICYWPGIRCEMEMKMETLGFRQFVDTARFYISIEEFLSTNKNIYKHIFMDEAEALCLALDGVIMHSTLNAIYRRYHDANCDHSNCPDGVLESGNISEKLLKHPFNDTWGELWFMVDINQASMFLPKHSPSVLKTPSIVLSKVMRATGYIFDVFKQFYIIPMPLLPKKIQKNMYIPEITIGHHMNGPPVYWVDSKNHIDKEVAKVVIDLCSTKGFKPNDLCVIPFLVNEKLIPESVNRFIDGVFVENSFRPRAMGNVEEFLQKKEINNFLIAWALRVKGLEFKVVIMAIDDDDFDFRDSEDRKKAYTMASRCTSMLILVSTESIKNDIDLKKNFQQYPFCINI